MSHANLIILSRNYALFDRMINVKEKYVTNLQYYIAIETP